MVLAALRQNDQQWLPRLQRMPNGKARYTYKRRSGEPAKTLGLKAMATRHKDKTSNGHAGAGDCPRRSRMEPGGENCASVKTLSNKARIRQGFESEANIGPKLLGGSGSRPRPLGISRNDRQPCAAE